MHLKDQYSHNIEGDDVTLSNIRHVDRNRFCFQVVKVAVEWMALLFRTGEVQGSNLSL
jgi:hypothetical protein